MMQRKYIPRGRMVNSANWHTRFQYDETGNLVLGEQPKGISATVPGLALPLNELLRRYAAGNDIKQFSPIYNDSIPEGIEGMDFDERAEMLQRVKAGIDDFRNNRKQAKADIDPVSNPQNEV